jgi:tetratricopeptide (TPR) repeat protein
MKYYLFLYFLVACSTTPDKSSLSVNVNESDESLEKQKPLLNNEVPDFYQIRKNIFGSALQDETTDNYPQTEISKLDSSGDPLLEISLKCQKGDFKGAFHLGTLSYQRFQKIPAYWNQLGNCHLNSGSSRKALLFYNKALELSADYVPALNNIGVMYTRQGQDQKALVAFERAQKISKFSKTPRYNLARIYLKYGLTDESLPLFQSLLSQAPDNVNLLNAIATAYLLLSDYQKALTYFEKIPSSEWKRAEIGLNYSLTLKNLNKTNDAKKIFQIVSLPKSSDLRSYYLIVKSHLGVAE